MKFEAIHNKDYSVVKTFKAAGFPSPFFYGNVDKTSW